MSRQQLGREYIQLTDEMQDLVLTQMELQGGATPLMDAIDLMPNLKEDRQAFFPKLKELVVVGYYTSEIGATEELRYNPMPMTYKGDIPVTEDTRNWGGPSLID
nr:gluconate 2-dehydrogenase subunit 3 family protein [Oceanicoccus sp. KOV_DT_Chl]